MGISEDEAKERNLNYEVYDSKFRPLKITLTDLDHKTYMKLIVDKDTQDVLGIHMAGDEAGEIMQGFAVAMKMGLKKQDLDKTIGIHPSSAEEYVTMRTPRK